ncbi:ribonuclease H-like domain-containing protein [Tanacetum coccineum]
MVPRAVLMKSGLVSINTARQNISKTAVLVNTARQVNAAHSKTIVNAARLMSYLSKIAHSTVKRDRQFSIARTPQQNGVAERRNKTLIKAARTMLADSKLPTTFWAKAVNTACYVQNKVLVVKPHNKTPYELFHGRTPTLSFMRPFGCPVTILNTKKSLGQILMVNIVGEKQGIELLVDLNVACFRRLKQIWNSQEIIEVNDAVANHEQFGYSKPI